MAVFFVVRLPRRSIDRHTILLLRLRDAIFGECICKLMPSILRITAILLLLASDRAVAMLPSADMDTRVFSIEDKDDRTVMAVEMTYGLYPENNFWMLYESIGKRWDAAFEDSSEYVTLWNSIYAYRGDRRRQAYLRSPQWYRDRVLAMKPPALQASEKLLEEKLKATRFLVKYVSGEYTVIVKEEPLAGVRKIKLPLPLRKINGKYRIVGGEYILNAHANYLIGLIPSLDIRRRSHPLSRMDVSELECFEFLNPVPRQGEKRVQFSVRYRERNSSAARRAVGKVFLFCAPRVALSRGYGERIAEIAERPSIADTPEGKVARLLMKCQKAKDLKTIKTLWHSAHWATIENKDAALRKQQGTTESERLARVALSPSRLGVAREARLVCSFTFESGHLFFLDRSRITDAPHELLATICTVEEQGKTVLADDFTVAGPGEGVVSTVLTSNEFKRGLFNYIKIRHPNVFEKLQAVNIDLRKSRVPK